jgi:hypothetical protein
MGLVRWLLLGDLRQQMDLRDHRREIEALRQRADSTSEIGNAQIDRLTAETKELQLYIAVIFRLLIAKKLVSPSELHDLIEMVDAEDGKSDGGYDGDAAMSAER